MRYIGATRFGREIGNLSPSPYLPLVFCCFTHIVSSILIAALFSCCLVTQNSTQKSI